MSTIAFDGKTIAFDTQVGTQFRIDPEPWQKIRDISGRKYKYAGGTGIAQAVETFIDWAKGGAVDSFPDLCKEQSDNCNFIAITYDGYAHIFDGIAKPLLITKKLDSIGSGSDYALGAMHAGACAEEAVEIAARLDPHTGGEIRSYAVGQQIKAVDA